jgi:hypothetical protein
MSTDEASCPQVHVGASHSAVEIMGMIHQEQYSDPQESPQYKKTDKKKND